MSTVNDYAKEMYGVTGGSQAIKGYVEFPLLGKIPYKPGSFFDLLVESFAGTHDFIGGQIPGFYDAEGNTSRGRSEMEKRIINTWAVTAILPSAPFALSDLIPPELMQILFTVGK